MQKTKLLTTARISLRSEWRKAVERGRNDGKREKLQHLRYVRNVFKTLRRSEAQTDAGIAVATSVSDAAASAPYIDICGTLKLKLTLQSRQAAT